MGAETNKKAAKASIGYVVGNYLLKGITFLSAPIFSRLLSVGGYGAFSSFFIYEGIIYIFIGMALHTSINTAMYRYKDKIEEYVSSIVLLILCNSVLWLIGACVFWNYYKDILGYSFYISILLILYSVASALLQVYNNFVGLSYNYKNFLKISYINALSSLILSILLILFVMPNNKYEGRIIGASVPLMLISIYFVLFFFRKAKPTIKKEYFVFGIKYSIPLIPHGIASVILASFDMVMIRKIRGDIEAGIYSFAYNICQIFAVLSNSIQNVWKPWFFEKMEEKKYDEIRKTATWYVFTIAYVAMMIIIISPEITKIMGPKDYWEANNCVMPVILGGFFSFLYTIPSLVEYYYQKTTGIGVASVCAACVNIILNAIFIPRYGYIAAACTTVFTYLLYFIFHYIMAIKCNGFCLFDTKKIIIISSGLTIVSLCSVFLEKYWMVRWAMDIVLGSVFLILAEKNFHISALLKKKERV